MRRGKLRGAVFVIFYIVPRLRRTDIGTTQNLRGHSQNTDFCSSYRMFFILRTKNIRYESLLIHGGPLFASTANFDSAEPAAYNSGLDDRCKESRLCFHSTLQTIHS